MQFCVSFNPGKKKKFKILYAVLILDICINWLSGESHWECKRLELFVFTLVLNNCLKFSKKRRRLTGWVSYLGWANSFLWASSRPTILEENKIWVFRVWSNYIIVGHQDIFEVQGFNFTHRTHWEIFVRLS